jgi:hypothetical protein
VALDFARVAALLHGWRSVASPLSAAACRVSTSSQEVARVARVYTTSGGHSGLATEVAMAVVAFPSDRIARQARAQAGNPRHLACLGKATAKYEEQRVHRHVKVEISTQFPSWVPRDAAAALRAGTVTIWKRGYRLPEVTTTITLFDQADPAISYQLHVTQAEGSIPADLIERLLAAAERRPVPAAPAAATYRYGGITCQTDPLQEDIFCTRSDGRGTSVVLAPLLIFTYTAKAQHPSFTHVNLGGDAAKPGKAHAWFVFNDLACARHSRGTVFCARADNVGYGFAISTNGLTVYRLSDMKPVFQKSFS